MATCCYICNDKIGIIHSKQPLIKHKNTNEKHPNQLELSKIIPQEVLCPNCIVMLGILDKDPLTLDIKENLKKSYLDHVKKNYVNCKNEDVQFFWETKIYNYEKEMGILDDGETRSQKLADKTQYKEDVKKYNELNRYISFEGKQKKIAMLNDKIMVLTAELNGQILDGEKFYKNMKQPEMSWAIMGGIADGIAGPAAGVITALNVQEKNQEIRKQNELWRNVAVAANVLQIEEKQKIKKEIEEIKDIMKKLEVSEVEEISSDEAKNKIDVIDISVQAFSCGTIHVSAQVIPKSTKVTEKYLDGFLKAILYDSNNQIIGECILTLPLEGARYSTTVEGVLLDVTVENKTFKAEIIPHKVWLMDKLDMAEDFFEEVEKYHLY